MNSLLSIKAVESVYEEKPHPIFSNKNLSNVIFSKLSIKEKATASLVNKTWKANVIENEKLNMKAEIKKFNSQMKAKCGYTEEFENFFKLIDQSKELESLDKAKKEIEQTFESIKNFEIEHEKKVKKALGVLKELLPYLSGLEQHPYSLLKTFAEKNIGIFESELENKNFFSSIRNLDLGSVIDDFNGSEKIPLTRWIYLLELKKANSTLLEKLKNLQEEYDML